MMHDWLARSTGHDGHWWMQRLQTRIQEHSSPTEDPDHDQTATTQAFCAVLTDLIQALEARFPVTGEPYDGNMRMAACASCIMTLWYSRLQLAKIHDPHRPLATRQEAYRRLLLYQHAIVDALMNMTDDSTYFPGQSWQSPFLFDATSGDFV